MSMSRKIKDRVLVLYILVSLKYPKICRPSSASNVEPFNHLLFSNLAVKSDRGLNEMTAIPLSYLHNSTFSFWLSLNFRGMPGP